MTEKDQEFKMRVVEKTVVPGRKGNSVGTGSSTGESRFNFTVSQESFRLGVRAEPTQYPHLNLKD